MKRFVADTLTLAGCGMIIYTGWLVFEPLAYLIGGVTLLMVGKALHDS